MINATNKSSGTDFQPIAAGSYPARCYSMIHIGTVEEEILGTKKILNKVRIFWELPTELKVFKVENGEQPSAISKEFNLSMNEKANLRKMLEGWRGKGFTESEAENFDITKLLGKACLINVIHKTAKTGSKVYAEISSISALPKGFECPPQVNKTFEFNYDNFDQKVFDSLPDYLKDKMKQSEEYAAIQFNQHQAFDLKDQPQQSNGVDDLPF
ncbi:MAG: hypothetical protein WCI97_11250 [Bacteroidota bacterium]